MRAARGLPGFEAIPDHSMNQRDARIEMFAPPPPEIGEVISGSSTLREGENGWQMWLRIGLVVVTLGVGAIIASSTETSTAWIVMLVAAAVAWWAFAATKFSHFTTYVGTDGVARINLKGSRTGPRTHEVLKFANADGLLTATTHHSTNGSYQHTTFSNQWKSRAGNVIFSMGGQYNKNKIGNNDGVHFARAAEIAWSQRQLGVCLDQLGREGSVAFPLTGGKVIRVGAGFLEFIGFQQDPVRVTKAEIATVTLGGGEFLFKHVDAKWYSGKGKFNFSYANMSNARLFLLILEKLMGYRWS